LYRLVAAVYILLLPCKVKQNRNSWLLVALNYVFAKGNGE